MSLRSLAFCALISCVTATPLTAQDFDFLTADSATSLGRIADPDSVISIEAPPGWAHVDLGIADATISVASEDEEAVLVVIVEDKVDMFGWNLDRYSYLTFAQSLISTDFPEIFEITDLEIDGRPGRRFDFHGAVQGTQLRYLKYTIDGPTAFIQIIGWSTRSTFDTYGPILEGIASSMESLR